MRRLCAAALALTLLPPLAGAQNPFGNKKFLQGLLALNSTNVASLVYVGSAGDARYTVSINYGFGSRQVDVQKATKPKRVVTSLANGVGWVVTDGKNPTSAPAVAAQFETAIAMTPHGVFKYAQMPESKVAVADEPGPGGRPATTVTLTVAGGRIKATLNDASLVARVETLPADGSAPLVVTYADYRDVDGMKFPFRITETQGSSTVDLTLTEVRPNAGFYVEPPAKLATPKK
jgi:hypothetical protein